MFTGIKSIIYPSANLDADTAFWETVTGVKPYFSESYYVGFNVNGNELGLDPHAAQEGLDYPITYWNVASVTEATQLILSGGATQFTQVKDVGGGMLLATFKDLSGNIFGIIEHPNIEI